MGEPANSAPEFGDLHELIDLENDVLTDEHAVADEDPTMMNRNAVSSPSVVEEIMSCVLSKRIEVTDDSNEYYSAADNNQGNVCEPLTLLHKNFYDKPLGRFLQDDLFDKTSSCRSCRKPAEAHVKFYIHPQGKLTINVTRLRSVNLSGEKDGNIWMCHRCSPVNGVPPASRRVVMSDAARDLSFRKFLELSFSNHSTACGHSLQRDCLRFYGLGSMVAIFRYSPIDILSVRLPPSVLEFSNHVQQGWLKEEVAELSNKRDALYDEILKILDKIKQKSISGRHGVSDTNNLYKKIEDMNKLLILERNESIKWLQPCGESVAEIDVYELNGMRDHLVIRLHGWDRKLESLDSIFEETGGSANSSLGFSYSPIIPIVDVKSCRTKPLFISQTTILPVGARLIRGRTMISSVYENEPTSIISCALASEEYNYWFTHQSLYTSHHLLIEFEDDTGNNLVKFSVTCYCPQQFDELRKKCFPSETDYLHSLCRCKKFNAQGGKSGADFAKSLDERFIIKAVTKTELDSFVEFAQQYLKYLTDSLNTGSQTCLAKIFGIYEVNVKPMSGGKVSNQILVVMENLFFNKKISRIYDLKGCTRSRYNSDVTGTMLDMNLLKDSLTNPLFLGSRAKRNLERAVWNDTSFLASINVMDYSLLVGVDKESKELVIGIIDFMREYTLDKRVETWVKVNGILVGPKNASPTIISPKDYKKRFWEAMKSYFLTVPDQWGRI